MEKLYTCPACAASRHYDCDNRVYFGERGPCDCEICESIEMDAENDLTGTKED